MMYLFASKVVFSSGERQDDHRVCSQVQSSSVLLQLATWCRRSWNCFWVSSFPAWRNEWLIKFDNLVKEVEMGNQMLCRSMMRINWLCPNRRELGRIPTKYDVEATKGTRGLWDYLVQLAVQLINCGSTQKWVLIDDEQLDILHDHLSLVEALSWQVMIHMGQQWEHRWSLHVCCSNVCRCGDLQQLWAALLMEEVTDGIDQDQE